MGTSPRVFPELLNNIIHSINLHEGLKVSLAIVGKENLCFYYQILKN